MWKTDSDNVTAWWWHGRGARRVACAWLLAALSLLPIGPVLAEPLSQSDVEEIVRLRTSRGGAAADVAALIEQAAKAGERGLPADVLANKIKEGLAKGVEPKRIEPVLGQLIGHLDRAQEVFKEAANRGLAEPGPGPRTRAVETLAEALARGVTSEEIRDLERQARQSQQRLTPEGLAAGAKGLALIKEGGLSTSDGRALVGDAMQRGVRSAELVDLAREIKRRGSDFQSGRLRVQSVREAIARGDRLDQVFRDDRGDRGSRSGDQGGSGSGREERLERRGDQGSRGGESRGGRPDRPERLDRSGR
jgi:hypothetical protein